jgi:hypothetical protein
LTALLASECSVPGATTIQINISFVLADGLDLATAWQIPALGLVLSEKGLFLRERLRRVLYMVC